MFPAPYGPFADFEVATAEQGDEEALLRLFLAEGDMAFGVPADLLVQPLETVGRVDEPPDGWMEAVFLGSVPLLLHRHITECFLMRFESLFLRLQNDRVEII